MTDPIHIIGLKADNVKRLQAVDLTLDPKGALIPVTGKNGAGKTTLLELALWAFGGRGAHDAVPVTVGEDKGSLEVRTSNGLTIRWSFTPAGAYLTVTNAEGFSAPKQQTLLDRLVGSGGGLDPHEFMRLHPREQAERLRDLTGVDTREIESKIGQAFEKRKTLNAQVRAESTRLDDMRAPPEDADFEPLDLAELQAEMDAAREVDDKNQRLRAQLVVDEEAHAGCCKENVEEAQEIARLEAELRDLQALHDDHMRQEAAQRDSIEALRREVDAIVDLDPAPLLEKAKNLKNENLKRAEWRAYREQATYYQKAKLAADNKTAELDDLRAKRLEMIAAAEMPIPGLGFGEGGVTYNDLPFAQAAHSTQLKVSLAIAMALRPELRVITFSDASLLDEESLQVVRELAEGEGYQIFAEIVGDALEQGIHIVDGSVVQVDGIAVEDLAMLKPQAD